MPEETKLLFIIKKLEADTEKLFCQYVAGIEFAINEVSKRRKGLDMELTRQDKNSIKAMNKALAEVVEMRDSYIRCRERYKYEGLGKLLTIVNDWFDFMSIVAPIHLKSAELIIKKDSSVREFSFEEKDQLIKLEEIRKRFQVRLN